MHEYAKCANQKSIDKLQDVCIIKKVLFVDNIQLYLWSAMGNGAMGTFFRCTKII